MGGGSGAGTGPASRGAQLRGPAGLAAAIALRQQGAVGPSSVSINVNGDAAALQQVLEEYFGQLGVQTTGAAVSR